MIWSMLRSRRAGFSLPMTLALLVIASGFLAWYHQYYRSYRQNQQQLVYAQQCNYYQLYLSRTLPKNSQQATYQQDGFTIKITKTHFVFYRGEQLVGERRRLNDLPR